MNSIKLYIIVGFLGSGKTTLLKNLIHLYKDSKIGIIMNDFGEQNIDSKLMKEELSQIKEVTNGSLFCSCKSDQFVEQLIEYSKTDLDIIFVEGSGIANPNTIIKLLDLIMKKTNGKMDYKGTIGIVDASTVHKVIELNMVINQIAYSDLILLNKADKVSKEGLLSTVNLIRQYNKNTEIIPTMFSKVEWEKVEELHYHNTQENVSNKIDLNTQKIHLLLTDESIEQLYNLLETVSPYCNRIKGFVTSDTKKFIECIDGETVLRDYHLEADDGITFISVQPINLHEIIISEYHNIFQKRPTFK